jgi:serine/threonine protein kinase
MSRSYDPQHSLILDRFESDWARGDLCPEISSYLPDDGESSKVPRRELLIGLVMIDLERRWRSGGGWLPTIAITDGALPHKPMLEEYLARFPELGSHADLSTKLIAQEYRVRKEWGDQPSHEEYFRRFPSKTAFLSGALFSIEAGAALDTTVDSAQSIASGCTEADAFSTGRAFGQYELLEEIARGGMGVVYKAWQKNANRIVAVKMILSGHLADQEEVKRFEREAEAAANLDHPGIVPIYDVGTVAGQHYFSMGFVEGRSLKVCLTEGTFPSRRAADVLVTIADAVEYAHQKGIVHRDLKPANVLMDSENRPRVTDFGLAKRLNSDNALTATGQVMGTPSYMPPEQAAGKLEHIGPTADVYSLGAVLYELLTGRPPFMAATLLETLMQVLENEPVSPRALNPTVDKDIETICLKCLSKQPSRRYQRTAELVDDLKRYLAHEPIYARPTSSIERLGKWVRRHPSLATLASVVLLALVAVSLLWFEATTARNREIKRRMQTRSALDEMTSFVIEDLLAQQTELTDVHEQYLRRALKQYREFADDTPDDKKGLEGLAATYMRIGGIQERLGDLDDAAVAFRHAIIRYKQLEVWKPGSFREPLIAAQINLAAALQESGELDSAIVSYEIAASSLELENDSPKSDRVNMQRFAASINNNLGNLYSKSGRESDAVVAFHRAIHAQEAVATNSPEHFTAWYSLGMYYRNYGRLLDQTLGNAEEAQVYFRKGIALQRQLGKRTGSRDCLREIALGQMQLSVSLFRLGDVSEAVSLLGEGIELQEKLVGDFPAQPELASELATMYERMGLILVTADNRSGGMQRFQKAVVLRKRLVAGHPNMPEYLDALSMLYSTMARWIDDANEGETMCYEAISLRERLIETFPDVPAYRIELGSCFAVLGAIVERRGRVVEALKLYDKSISVLESLPDSVSQSTRAKGLLEASSVLRALAISAIEEMHSN